MSSLFNKTALCLICLLLFFAGGIMQQNDYPIQQVPLKQVHLTDTFWVSRMETNRTVTMPYVFKRLEELGRMDNFAIAGGLKTGEQKGSYPFDDTDVYKTIEGAAYSLVLHPDPKLEAYVDSVIALIAAAQEDDGYLYTARTNNSARLRSWFGDARWVRENGSHELYDAGHMYEAASAYYEATGKKNFLIIAIKNAELVNTDFGPDKLATPPGHQVIEMGLVKLYRVTGDKRYVNLAKFLLDVRGKPINGRRLGGTYNQDHKPVIEQDEAVGHAVRAAYMYGGMTDIAALTGDTQYSAALDKLWSNVVGKKLYVTGGLGSQGSGEGFSKNYDLPNMSAYNESCASIANIFWNYRMFLLHGDAKYIDIMERTLYNAFLSGISLKGNEFYYPNPLESTGQHERRSWYTCACCIGNIVRMIASVPGYVYAQQKDNLFVIMYADNEAEITFDNTPIKIKQKTRYPWDGTVQISVEPKNQSKNFSINLRIPGWAQNTPVPSDLYRYIDAQKDQVKLTVNGKTVNYTMKNGFAQINREWKSGDVIELILPMTIHRIAAIDSVAADRGRVALQRGPIVFCAEWPDNEGGHIRNLLLPDTEVLKSEFKAELLNGIQIITGTAYGYKYGADGKTLEKQKQQFTAIPYYAWAHRGRGEMAVWLARDESAVNPLKAPTLASMSKVSVSCGTDPGSVNDLLEPRNSNDHSVPYYHWWAHKGTTEWIQYTFPKEEEVSTVEVYWFDDTGVGECRVPKSWRILYKEGDSWKPVYSTDTYGVKKDTYNKVVFETVKTTVVRLEIQSQENFAGGIHEWRIK